MCNDLSNQMIDISTHDLARRSTVNTFWQTFYKSFQLTTSQGGRRNCRDIWKDCRYFNSRPRKEVDDHFVTGELGIDISTHDLARRST